MSAPTTTSTLPDFELVDIDSIEIGDRYRANPEAQLDSLAESIDTLGLLNPVVITSDRKLVAGHRRILAVQKLGYEQIEAHILHDLDDATMLLGEHDENVCRVNFSTGEARAVYKARKELLAPLAEENSKEAGTANLTGEKGAAVRQSGSKKKVGRVADAAAAGTGKSADTLDRAEQIEKIANDESQPAEVQEVAKTALAQVDADEKPVNTALNEVKQAQEKAAGERGQAKALKQAITALEKTAAALEKAFLDNGVAVENFDTDCTPELIKESWKEIRAAWSRFNAVSKEISKVS
jgi:ParB family transcriptional regulator, chromosome partitioning protein